MIGNKPAHITANNVMASAERFTEVRHFWRNRNRIAEISVPAWPIPTQKTKFVISKAHPTVVLSPQVPTPVAIWYAIAATPSSSSANATANPAHHNADGGRSMGRHTSSV